MTAETNKDRRDWSAICYPVPVYTCCQKVPRGDGFCLQKKRINSSCKEGVGGDQIAPLLTPRQVMLSSEKGGSGTSVTDSAPAGDELPVPRVDHREDRETLYTLAYKLPNAHRHTIREGENLKQPSWWMLRELSIWFTFALSSCTLNWTAVVMNMHVCVDNVHKLNTEPVNCQLHQVNDTSITPCSFSIDFLGTKLIDWLPITMDIFSMWFCAL